jgi:hypothetical protein
MPSSAKLISVNTFSECQLVRKCKDHLWEDFKAHSKERNDYTFLSVNLTNEMFIWSSGLMQSQLLDGCISFLLPTHSIRKSSGLCYVYRDRVQAVREAILLGDLAVSDKFRGYVEFWDSSKVKTNVQNINNWDEHVRCSLLHWKAFNSGLCIWTNVLNSLRKSVTQRNRVQHVFPITLG